MGLLAAVAELSVRFFLRPLWKLCQLAICIAILWAMLTPFGMLAVVILSALAIWWYKTAHRRRVMRLIGDQSLVTPKDS